MSATTAPIKSSKSSNAELGQDSAGSKEVSPGNLKNIEENNYISGYDSPITMSLHGSNSNSNSQHNSDHEDDIEIHDSSYNSMSYNEKTLSLEDISNMTQLNLLHVIQESNKKMIEGSIRS